VKKCAVPPSKAAAPAKQADAPAKPAIPAKAAPQITITLKHIAAELAEGHDLSKKAVESVLDDFVALITRQLVKGDKIRLSGLGILQVRDRPARTARNPATGESVAVAASKKIAFRPAKELKNAMYCAGRLSRLAVAMRGAQGSHDESRRQSERSGGIALRVRL
jgi:DNA-binding protein HU-beta